MAVCTQTNSEPVVLEDTVCSIPLDRGLFAIIDSCEYEKISKNRYIAKRGRNTWYAIRYTNESDKPDKNIIFMHNEIMGEKEGYEVDHKNNNGLDNRHINLRHATHIQNLQNQRRNGNESSKYKGVRFMNNRWVARITINKKLIHLGTFKGEGGEIEAARCYDRAAIQHYGEFANINLEYPENLNDG
jgi:hypothetical protein